MATASRSVPESVGRAAFKAWIIEFRRAAREWARTFEPPDIVFPVALVREAYIYHLVSERSDLEDDWASYANIYRMSAEAWHHCGTDIVRGLEKRGYERLPNALLSQPDASQYAGEGDLFVQKPTKKSKREHVSIVLDGKRAKRDRTVRLEENAKKGIAKLDEEIAQLESWMK